MSENVVTSDPKSSTQSGDTMFLFAVNALIALVRSFIHNQAIVEAIKAAAAEAVTHTEWAQGEKTNFVINAGFAIVQATPSPYDDFLYQTAAFLYLRRYAGANQRAMRHADSQEG